VARPNPRKKPDFAPLLKSQSLENITLQEAITNFQLPRVLGKKADEEILVNVGRYGPYIKHGKTFVSITEDDLFTISLEEAREKIREKEEIQKNRIIHDYVKEGIQVLNGQYGPYISDGKKNAKIPKEIDPKTLTPAQCKKMLAVAPEKKRSWRKR
jgi:DNA topoisomerase-1